MHTNNSRYLSAAISAILSLAAAGAQADPRNGVVTSGTATISTPNANVTQIDQSSNTASINWQSFDVGAQERVIFNQPSSTSVALNRIQGQDPSQIQGSIAANGRVFLINPNGIIFGASARINVGSLVASSLDLTAADAQSGRYSFDAGNAQAGAIVNDGQITAANGGSVTLLGSSVLNNGLIVANFGTVNLGAGRTATLDFVGAGLARFEIDAGSLATANGRAAVDNQGTIVADGGQVLLTARQANDVIARAVNNDGVIRAARVENVGGRIRLVGAQGGVVNTGTLDATGVGAGSTGGEVQVLGEQVTLAGTSLVDVSGSAGGGSAFIGGGFQGADSAILNSQRTDVAAGAVIRADSLVGGDAGQVVVWSDGTTDFNGQIFARALGANGNGGRAEVSGHEHLRIGGHAWLQSTHGTAGTLLLDPGSVTITNGPNTAPPVDFDVFNDGWVNDQLTGSSLTIQTTGSDNNAAQTLLVTNSADINWANANSLTLEAGAALTLATGSTIQNSGSGALMLTAGGAVTLNGDVTLGGGLSVSAGGSISQGAGVLTVGGVSDFSAPGGQSIILDNAANTFTGAVGIASNSGGNLSNVTIFDTNALNLTGLTISGVLRVTASSITQSGPLDVLGDAHFTVAGGQSIALGDTGNRFRSSTFFDTYGGGNILNLNYYDAATASFEAVGIDGNLTLGAGDQIVQTAVVSVGGNTTLTADRAILFDAPGTTFTGTVTIVHAGGGALQDVSLRDTTALDLGAFSITDDLTLTAPTLTQSGAWSIGDDATFNIAGGQSLTLNAANVFGGTIHFDTFIGGNVQDVTVRNLVGTDFGASTIGGILTANAASFAQSGALTVAGATSLTANGGQSIVLDDTGNSFGGPVSLLTSAGTLQNVTLYDTTALDLQALTITGNLNVAGASLSQSGALQVAGASVFAANGGQSITLNNAGNALIGAVGFAANSGTLQNVTLVNAAPIDFQATTLNGTLTATTGGGITQSGALVVAGSVSLTAAAGQSIVLGNSGNSFGNTIAFLSSGPGNLLDVTVRDSTSLDLLALTLGGNLSATSGALLSQSGALNVGGTTTLAAAGGTSVAFNNASNVFTGAVSIGSSGGGNLLNASVTANSALQLAALTLGGNLTTSATSLTQSGAFVVGGNSSFTAANTQSIVLGNAGNSFTGTVGVTASSGTLQNVTLRDLTALDLQAMTLAGNLTATSGGSLTQSGALNVVGNSIFTAGNGQSITLNNSGNSFTGVVSFAAGAGTLLNVAVTDTTALDLQALSIGGNLTASAAALTQSGALSIGGVSSFAAAGGQSVVLGNAGNAFAGAVSVTSSGGGNLQNVTLHDSNALDLQALSLAGSLDVAATSITQSGALVVGGSAAFVASAGQSIVLNNAANAFGGAIGFAANGAGNLQNVTVTDSTALQLQALTLDGNLAATSGASLTQSGALIVAGTSAFVAGSGQSITLDNVGNTFTGAVTFAAGGAGNLQNVTVNDASALDLQALTLGGALNVTAQGDINLRQIDAGGAVSIRSTDGSILDDQADAVAASLSSGTGGIQLQALNNIGSVTDLATRQGSAIAVSTNGGAISAQVASATGQVNLGIVGGNSITAGAGAIAAGGSGRLLLQSAGDLSFDAFSGAIAGFTEIGLSSAATLTLPTAPGALNFGPGSTLLIRGVTDVVGAGGRVFSLDAGHLVFESGGLGGDVTLNTHVDSLDASLGNSASLTVSQATGALALGAVSAGGNVSISATNIVDDGDASGVTRITAGNVISLHAANGIGAQDGSGGGRIDTAGPAVSVTADAGDAFIAHLGDVQLDGAVSGLLDVAATGAITDTNDGATRVVARDLVLAATQIGSQANVLNIDATTLSATAPNGLYVSDANSLQLRSILATNVVINAVGSITDDGSAQTRIVAAAATLQGAALGASGAGNEIDTSVDRLSATATNGGIYIGAANSIELGSISAAGAGNDIVITAPGAITDDGDNATRVVGRSLTLSGAAIGAAAASGELDVQLASLTATASSGGIYVSDADDLQLNSVTAAGNSVVLSAAGALTDDADDTTRVTGADVSLTASAIGAAGNRIDTAATQLSAVASNGGVHIDEADSVVLTNVRSSGSGNTVNLRTANNGDIVVQSLVTQGGAVTLTAGGTGSLNVSGSLESNNGVVNLNSGNVLGVPGLNTGTGSAILHTVNDVNVGTINANVISITSDTGSVVLGTANAGAGTVTINAANGAIVDNAATSITAGEATLSARSIGSVANPLNIAVGTLTASATAGGVFIDDSVGLTANGITATGAISLVSSGAFIQNGAIASGASGISVLARDIDMDAAATTLSNGGDITYIANADDVDLAVLNAAGGRVLVIAADNVFTSLASSSTLDNLAGSMVEVRVGGLAAGSGQIGAPGRALQIATPASAGRTVFLIVPAANGIQRTTPQIDFLGAPSSRLLKGYSGSGGALLFDRSSTFTADTVLLGGESIVPLANGRVAVNTDSLSAAKQALSSGVISRSNIDWAAFDPNVSLFGTLDPSVRLPADQIDEVAP